MTLRRKVLLLGLLSVFSLLALVACSDNNASTATKAASTTSGAVKIEMAATNAPNSTAPAATVTAATASAGDPNRGGQIFRRSCQVCHAKGGTAEGPDGQPNLAASKNTDSAAFIIDRVRNGKTGGPAGAMPSFAVAGIRDAELDDIVAYVQALKKPEFVADTPTPMPTANPNPPTPTPTIPAPPYTNAAGKALSGSASRGEMIFRQTCQRCHANGGRTRGDKDQPNLSTNGNAWNPEFVRGVLNNGFGQMPQFGPNLLPQEIEDLVKYVTTINTTQKP